jgi:hypothetical protein
MIDSWAPGTVWCTVLRAQLTIAERSVR